MNFSKYYPRISHAFILAATFSLTPALAQHQETKNTTYTNKIEASHYNEAELAQILAPIALYPDTLLSHILIASTYSSDVIEANRWFKNNSHVGSESLFKYAKVKDWDPSVKALIAFPHLLSYLNDDVDWMQRLSNAFLSDEALVLASVQHLRYQADEAGSLAQLTHLRVERSRELIIITAPSSNIVQVPYYDTRDVYGTWHWRNHKPVRLSRPQHYSHNRGGFYWHRPVHLHNDFFFSAFNWLGHRVVIHNESRRFHSKRRYTQTNSSYYNTHWKKKRSYGNNYKNKYFSKKINKKVSRNIRNNNKRSYQQKNQYRGKNKRSRATSHNNKRKPVIKKSSRFVKKESNNRKQNKQRIVKRNYKDKNEIKRKILNKVKTKDRENKADRKRRLVKKIERTDNNKKSNSNQRNTTRV